MVTNNLVKKSVGFSENKNEEVLVKADHVSKKFCRSLKKALWYGVQDIGSEIIGRKYDHKLRPDEFWAVNDISFEVKRGECLGLIGPNGAGKSTLLKMLNGLIKPDQGSIMMRGRISALIELTAGFNPILTGLENIYNRAAILGLSKAEVDRKLDDIVEFAEIEDFLHMPVQSYSSGMKIRLGFAVAAQLEPDVLILDEVLAVGDVGFRAKCFNRIYQLMENSAVIFVSHTMPQVSRVCSSLLVMNQGQNLSYGKDVPKGIDTYYNLFQEEKKSQVIYDNRLIIHHIKVEDYNKKNLETITYLSPLKISIELTIKSENIKEFSIGITFTSLELQLVAQCHSSFNKADLFNTGQRMTVNLFLDQVPLNPGSYNLSIGIQENTMAKVLAKLNNFKRIRVIGDFYGHAPVQLLGNWKIINN